MITSDNTDYLSNLSKHIAKDSNVTISEFDEIKEGEVLKLVRKIDTSKSSNIPKINSRLFKNCLCSLHKLLSSLTSLSKL